MTRKRTRIILVIGLFLGMYISSYLLLSRRASREADEYGIRGFYYFLPEDSNTWRFKNRFCRLVFMPLNELDRMFGTGRYPASEPLWGLSR